MPDTFVTSANTETKAKPRNKKGFREPTSLHVDPKLWQEVRIMAVLKNVSVTEYFEDALRRKLDIDYREVGSQGYQVGQGGMYIPPSPTPQSQPQQTPPQSQSQQLHPQQDPKITQLTKELSSGVATIDKDLEVERSRALYLYDLATKGQITKKGQEITLPLPGIKFPANKDKIIEHAKKAQYPLKSNWADLKQRGVDINKLIEETERKGTREKIINKHIEYIRQLPNEIYNNKSELEKDLRTIIYEDKKDEMYEGRTIVIVDVQPLK